MRKIFYILIAFVTTTLFVGCEAYDNGYYTYIPPAKPEPSKENVGSDYYPYDKINNTPLDNFLEKVCIVNDEEFNYRMLFPKNYDKEVKYPLIIVLHGTGERGDNNTSQLTYGGSFFVKDEVRDAYPAIVVFPQCPSGLRWDSKNDEADKTAWTWDYKSEGTAPTELLRFLIMDMVDKGVVDESKLYVGGISMGAMGAYELAYRMPDYFAAGFFMSGGGNPSDIAETLPDMAFRIMHGDQDGVVVPAYATDMYNTLDDAGIKCKLDMYLGVSHSGWNSMFEEPDFMSWLWENPL